MARGRLGLDYSENMSDATTCSCMVSSVEKCSVRSCGSMFQEPFFLHPPGSRPRDGLYINPMNSTFGHRPKDTSSSSSSSNNLNGSSNGSESFYLHSPHEPVYTRITHLFDETPSLTVAGTSDHASTTSSSRASNDRKDEPFTVKVDVHITSNGNGYKSAMANGAGSPVPRSAGGSPRSDHASAKADSGSEHAYEQICIRQEPDSHTPSMSPKYAASPNGLLHKKLATAAIIAADNNAGSEPRAHRPDRRYSRSSSASESSNMSSEVHYSSATSTPSLSRNSSNERMSKSPKVPEIPTERKNSSTSSTRAESEKDTKPATNGPSIFRPPPPPPPPPPEIEEVVIVTSKVVESTVKEEKKDGSQSTTQEQKCEATITTISANKSGSDYAEIGSGSNESAAAAAASPPPPPPGASCRGGAAPEAAIGTSNGHEDYQQQQHHDYYHEEDSARRSNGSTTTTTTTTACQVTAHLVNRHMVLPFIPPKFAAQSADSDTLLKPSEYLRSICKAATVGANNTNSLSKARSVDNLDIQGRGDCSEEEESRKSEGDADEARERDSTSGPPPPPLPPPPMNGGGFANNSSLLSTTTTTTTSSSSSSSSNTTTSATSEARQTQQQLQQPLATISIHDLSSVQLRRTNLKMHATKTFSAPPNRSVSMTNVSEAVYVQRTDLIAELKKTKDIPGLKKLKVERAQNEKSQEQNLMSEISKNFSASNFVDQIPEKDSAGNVIPIWKRQMLARKAAERAKREMEEKIARENEEKRIQAIPPWKRQLLARKDSEYKGAGLNSAQPTTAPAAVAAAVITSPKIEVPVISKKELVVEISASTVPATAAAAILPSKSQDESKAAASQSQLQEDKKNESNDDNDKDTENVHIIPWRAQLRKTNSKLNILD